MESEEGRARWAERVAGWRLSGMGAKKYAESIGVSASALSYWAYCGLDESKRQKERLAARERRQARSLGKATPAAQASLVEITTVGTRDDRFELTWRDGCRLYIPASFSAAVLERLLSVLGQGR